jgi:hypothetical protein
MGFSTIPRSAVGETSWERKYCFQGNILILKICHYTVFGKSKSSVHGNLSIDLRDRRAGTGIPNHSLTTTQSSGSCHGQQNSVQNTTYTDTYNTTRTITIQKHAKKKLQTGDSAVDASITPIIP